MSSFWPLPCLTALVLLLSGCTYFGGESTIYVSSSPAGARILLDGQDTGETTPAKIELSTGYNAGGMLGSDRQITVRKTGFEAETRRVHQHSAFYTARWLDGATDFYWLTFPLFWTMGDFFTPFGATWTYLPREVHVQLFPAGEAPGKASVGPAPNR